MFKKENLQKATLSVVFIRSAMFIVAAYLERKSKKGHHHLCFSSMFKKENLQKNSVINCVYLAACLRKKIYKRAASFVVFI